MLLDQWKMFDTRARFDIARGKHRVSLTTRAADTVPPQVYVRCNFCSQSISHSLWIFGTKKDGNRVLHQYSGISGPGMMYRQKVVFLFFFFFLKEVVYLINVVIEFNVFY
jgi:hypothetical protein